jgi:hypothetical protein
MHGVARPGGAGKEEDKSQLLIPLHRKYILALQEKRVSASIRLLLLASLGCRGFRIAGHSSPCNFQNCTTHFHAHFWKLALARTPSSMP